MLAVPLLLGVAASRPDAWQVILAAAAVAAYLAGAAAVDWVRARRREYAIPAAVFGAVAAAAGSTLLVARPSLWPIVGLAALAATVAIGAAAMGRPRSLVASLAQAAQATALVPAAALVTGQPLGDATLRATLLAGLYLGGSVLLVRSLIRERGNAAFRAASIAFHAVGVAVAAWLLPWPYAILAALLATRAAVLPAVQLRTARGLRLRPIHIGLVEIAASVAVVGLGFAIGF